MKIIEFTTAKLIFPHGVTKEEVEQMLVKHTVDFNIANFYPDQEMGVNKIAFAVVEVPEKVLPNLYDEKIVTFIDPMTSFRKRPSNAETCSHGGG